MANIDNNSDKFLLNRKVANLQTWELYFGFVLIQIIIGFVIAIIIGLFDLIGIRGALSQVVRQIAVVTNGQLPQQYLQPIAGEVREGKFL